MAENAPRPGKSVERLFPFVARARLLMVGRERLAHSKRDLQCVLISEDISENSRAEVLRDFADYPILQRYTSAQFEAFFGVRNAKVLGLKKSSLAKSIYGELKEFRLNKPPPGGSKPGAAKKSG
jgi:hypothetical protein